MTAWSPYISIAIAIASLGFAIWATHNRAEVDDLDRAERKLADTERQLRDALRECESLRQQNFWLQKRALGLDSQQEHKEP